MRMGFADENLVAIAELGGDGHGHGHGHGDGHGHDNSRDPGHGDGHGHGHGHDNSRDPGHVHSHVLGHVQEGVHCVESWVHDNDDVDVGDIRCDRNDNDNHYLSRHHHHHPRCPRQPPLHCHCLALRTCALTTLCPQSRKAPIHPCRIHRTARTSSRGCKRQRDDFRPPGRQNVGAGLGVVDVDIVDQRSLVGSFSTVQLKEI